MAFRTRYKIADNKLYIIAGKTGKCLDKKALLSKLKYNFTKAKSLQVKAKLINKNPKSPTVEMFYSQMNIPAKNAEIKLLNNKKYEITKHIVGIKTAKKEIQLAIDKLKKENLAKVKVRTEIIQPAITEKKIKNTIFKNKLSKFSTIFPVDGVNNRNRASNIQLASSTINGTIVLPKTFSFNKIVGNASANKGYKVANTFKMVKWFLIMEVVYAR